jgi:hypothetical protein
MLLFIGGAARTGKGILARRLVCEAQLPYLSVDVLKMGLTRGVPEYEIDPDAGAIAVAERLWPLVREMSHNIIADEVNYLMEGEILPKNVDALAAANPSRVAACFLGYRTITPAQKLREIRTFAGHPNDWPQTYSDDALLPVIHREIAFSAYLYAESVTHGFPYFDLSRDFALTIDQVVAHVKGIILDPERRRAR